MDRKMLFLGWSLIVVILAGSPFFQWGEKFLFTSHAPSGPAAGEVRKAEDGSGFLLQKNSSRIELHPQMITNEYALGDASLLADEQHLAGYSQSSGKPTTLWHPYPKPEAYPISAFIDLGSVHHLKTISLFDAHNAGNIIISAGAPFKWQPLFTDPMKNYLQWNRHQVDIKTRYVRVTLMTPIGTPEIAFYGTRTETARPVAAVKALPGAEAPVMDGFIGINSFIDVPLETDKAAGFIREYHNWRWNEGKADGVIKHNPSYPGWNFDAYYADRKKNNIIVSPCLQSSVGWLTAESENKPVKKGDDPHAPRAYSNHARFMYQFAARYGSRQVAPAKLLAATDQQKVSGLNLLSYFENWNEQNKWWAGEGARFSPYEYAAMASADYDGHQGRMGNTFGIKNADPEAKLVMGGLASIDLEYIKSMKVWADVHRGGSFPADVLNFHHYCRSGEGKAQAGISPEEDKLKEKMQAAVAFRNKHLPGKEIWLTEFGYDVHPQSPQRAPAIGSFPAEEVQGQWLVRSYLELAASGIDRAVMYMIRDHATGNGEKYATSGLVSDKESGHKPRTSWYYVYTLKNTLSGTRFVREVPSGNALVRVYQFRHKGKNRDVFAVWCPTSNQTGVKNFPLPVGSPDKKVSVVTLVSGKTEGRPAPLAIQDNKVSVSVSETPVFVVVDGKENKKAPRPRP